MNRIRVITVWLWRASTGERWRILAYIMLGLLRIAASLGFVLVSKTLIDSATQHSVSVAQLASLAALLCILMLTQSAFSIAANYVNTRALTLMSNRLRLHIFNHLLYGRLDGDKPMHTGDMMNRIMTDILTVSTTVCTTLPSLVTMFAQLAGAFAMLYVFSHTLALLLLGILPLCLLVSKAYLRKMRRINADLRNSDSQAQIGMQEGLQHRTVVQTLESENTMSARVGSLLDDVFAKTMHRQKFSTFSHAMVSLGFIAGYLTSFIWGVWHLYLAQISFGTMTAFLQLVNRVQNPISSLTSIVPTLINAMTSVDRLIEVESLPKDAVAERRHRIHNPGIRLCDVSFAYAQGQPQIFRRFSHDFRPGTKTAIMGETGVGKSTLFKLLLALQKPESGSIEIYDSQSSQAVTAASRCNIVYVPQGNSLLHGTIRDNLLLADPEASEEQMREALHTAVADFVLDLPNGLDTDCFELGTGLSEGQAQRIAIARALLRKGSLLLLDEFNSALDPITADILIRRLIESRPGSTIIFITHRPDVARYVDDVITIGSPDRLADVEDFD